ncbi:HTTM domain-containing protein [Cellulomonas alba]|uniref:HTTM domain-containing protein n=1 Tax=Cellulomonas alba TaxID=3053467 RepID=A0ABT7SF86_9CELL|nr:hypothetical protein [Cellulomonas alba]MDM7854856.1 hypothetical protein [Cellulomonas alba]
MIRGLPRRLDARLTAPGPAYRLLEVQTLVALVIALRLLVRPWVDIADRPPVLISGLGVMSWLRTTPSAGVVVAIQVLGLVGIVTYLVRRRWAHAGYVVGWLCYLVLAALWGSSGKVMHNDVLTVWVALPLLFASVPARDDERTRAVRWGWPPRASLAVLATVYFLTGFQKLRHSGPRWVFSDNMANVLRQGASPYAQGLSDFVSSHVWLAQCLAGGALALELTAIVWLSFRRTRWLFAVAVFVMHTSIWLFLGLDYSAWVLTAAAVAVPMSLPDGTSLLDLVRRVAGRRSAAPATAS